MQLYVYHGGIEIKCTYYFIEMPLARRILCRILPQLVVSAGRSKVIDHTVPMSHIMKVEVIVQILVVKCKNVCKFMDC